jgi:DNA-binding NarL/FixJ family response regulator
MRNAGLHAKLVEMPLRLVIVDDNAPFLAALRDILQGRDLSVVGEAATAAEALQRVAELRPDVVLLDIDLGDDNGIELAQQLADDAGSAAPEMIFISAYPADDFADIVEQSPALGFISKSDLSASAITELLRGDGAVPGDDSQRESR